MADLETGWFYEAGIGENRAALIAGGELKQIRIERHNDALKAGAILDAKFKEQWVAGISGIVALDNGQEALLQPLPKGLTEGASVRVEIVREAMAERGGQAKRAKARPAAKDAPLQSGPGLSEELEGCGQPVQHIQAHDDDRLVKFGWYEAIEEAETGRVAFEGGSLLISLTPAMTMIDVDGTLPPRELAMQAARAVALVCIRLDIGGNIGIDFPTLTSKADRTVVCDMFDEHMTGDCERTAINGFGFMQIVRKKIRPSVLEIVQSGRVKTATLQLLRQAERAEGAGAMMLSIHPALESQFIKHPHWLEELSKRTGRPVSVKTDGKIPITAGMVIDQNLSS